MEKQNNITPKKELYDRILKFQSLMQENRLNGSLVCQNVDLFYFTGTIQRSFLYIPVIGEPLFMVKKSFTRARQESNLKYIEQIHSSKDIPRLLKEYGFFEHKIVGLEFDVLPTSYFLEFKKFFPDVSFQDVSLLIKKVRMIKSDFEIKNIKESIKIIEKVLDYARNHIREGMTELELDGILGALARKEGHQGRVRIRGWNQEMFYTAVLCGGTAGVPSYMESPIGGPGTTPAIAQGASKNKIKKNEPIFIDFGVGINGYIGDMTRTYTIGRLPDKLYKSYSVLKEIESKVIEKASPGTPCSALYNEAEKIAEKRGFDRFFMGCGEGKVFFIAHGIGLEIDELPVISRNYHSTLKEGMVFALEPKFIFPGLGAIGFENDFLITKDGPERLSRIDNEIIHID
ncbi:MAG: Xaa-Pro peptidase family protein [Thermodesulfobacteriota bacterium]|nr:Xaa-Pro peptidase family protein [Thermodesulfobacteriota bacterium]